MTATGADAAVEHVDLGDVRLAYERHGADGPWIALVHGGLVGRPTWRAQLPTRTKPNLLDAGRLLCYDQRGYGASAAPGGHDVAALAGDLVRLLEALAIERTVLVCFSLGGFVALEAAVRAPERVLALALESCGEPTDALRRQLSERADALETGDSAREIELHVSRAFSARFVGAQPENVRHYAALARRADPRAVAGAFRSISAWRPSAAMAELPCPKLVINGADDPGFGPGAGRALRERLPGASQAVVSRAGHTVHLERAPGFNHLVTELVDGLALR
jgi:pimeloyl-ACP methyl ester carboxylesterase